MIKTIYRLFLFLWMMALWGYLMDKKPEIIEYKYEGHAFDYDWENDRPVYAKDTQEYWTRHLKYDKKQIIKPIDSAAYLDDDIETIVLELIESTKD